MELRATPKHPQGSLSAVLVRCTTIGLINKESFMRQSAKVLRQTTTRRRVQLVVVAENLADSATLTTGFTYFLLRYLVAFLFISMYLKLLYILLSVHCSSAKTGISSFKKLSNSSAPDITLLSFDDGPHNIVTPALLKLFQKHNVKATFFVVGRKISRYAKFEETIKSISAAGHTIGIHGWDHKNLIKLERHEVLHQINATLQQLRRILGYSPNYIRVPYGLYNHNVASIIQEFNLTLIARNVNPKDFLKSANASHIYSYLSQAVTSGGDVILLHETLVTAEAMENVVQDFRDKGFEMVSVEMALQRSRDWEPVYENVSDIRVKNYWKQQWGRGVKI